MAVALLLLGNVVEALLNHGTVLLRKDLGPCRAAIESERQSRQTSDGQKSHTCSLSDTLATSRSGVGLPGKRAIAHRRPWLGAEFVPRGFVERTRPECIFWRLTDVVNQLNPVPDQLYPTVGFIDVERMKRTGHDGSAFVVVAMVDSFPGPFIDTDGLDDFRHGGPDSCFGCDFVIAGAQKDHRQFLEPLQEQSLAGDVLI